ncbi:uncharacterized protein LOC134845751 isoform X2 [Symsagittifera roscoffensis]
MSSLEKVLGDWGGGMGGLQQQEGSGSGSGSGSVGTVRALLLGSPSSGRTQFRQACATLYSNQPARPQSQLNHAADRLPLLRDRDSESTSDSLHTGTPSHTGSVPPPHPSHPPASCVSSSSGGGGGSGGGSVSVRLSDRDSVDLVYKRQLLGHSDYHWQHKAVKLHLVELDRMKERDHRTEYAPPSTTRGTTAKTSTGGGGGGGAVWKLRDNLDCAVVFVDASQTDKRDANSGDNSVRDGVEEECYEQLARILPLVIVYNLNNTNKQQQLPHPTPLASDDHMIPIVPPTGLDTICTNINNNSNNNISTAPPSHFTATQLKNGVGTNMSSSCTSKLNKKGHLNGSTTTQTAKYDRLHDSTTKRNNTSTDSISTTNNLNDRVIVGGKCSDDWAVKKRLRRLINYERFIMAAEEQVLEVVVDSLDPPFCCPVPTAGTTVEGGGGNGGEGEESGGGGVGSVVSAILRQGTLRKCLHCGPNPRIVAQKDIVRR